MTPVVTGHRRFLSLVSVLLVALGASGCANWHEDVQLGPLSVHTFRRDHANAHLLSQGGSLVLVDAGLPKNAPALEADIREAGFDPKRIRAVVLTHGHADHAGGARHFKERFGASIVAGAGDRAMLESGKNEPLCPTSGFAQGRLEEDQTATYQPTSADIWIDAPRPLAEIAGIEGTVMPVAGHTSGSLVVLTPKAAFVGDLFRGSIVGYSAERHFYMCDLADNDEDIRSLLGASPARMFFTGHFGPVDRLAVEGRFGASAAGRR
jgi:glyoxylase-like metal-dependent hydrolase (beta-lactamase superfamily II)